MNTDNSSIFPVRERLINKITSYYLLHKVMKSHLDKLWRVWQWRGNKGQTKERPNHVEYLRTKAKRKDTSSSNEINSPQSRRKKSGNIPLSWYPTRPFALNIFLKTKVCVCDLSQSTQDTREKLVKEKQCDDWNGCELPKTVQVIMEG